jgi:ABC-type multidrug transport system ATPase subunit
MHEVYPVPFMYCCINTLEYLLSQFIFIHMSIRIEGLSKQFTARTVLSDCSVTIPKGMVFGLVGRNGAGKTTFIRIVLGLLKQDAGSISVLGCSPWQHEAALYRRLGVVLENDGFAPNLTLRENIKLFASAKNISWADVQAYIAASWNNTFIENEFAAGRTKVKYLSRGQKVQSGICRAFLGNPDVLVLDEPTVALDVDAYDHVCNLIRTARERGAAVLISSHQLSAIEDVCDTVGILHNGKLTMLDTGDMDTDMQEWRIVAGCESRFAAIIQTVAQREPVYQNGAWHIAVAHPDSSIPELVRLLAAAGCDIREVAPVRVSLKEHIQAYYEND